MVKHLFSVVLNLLEHLLLPSLLSFCVALHLPSDLRQNLIFDVVEIVADLPCHCLDPTFPLYFILFVSLTQLCDIEEVGDFLLLEEE